MISGSTTLRFPNLAIFDGYGWILIASTAVMGHENQWELVFIITIKLTESTKQSYPIVFITTGLLTASTFALTPTEVFITAALRMISSSQQMKLYTQLKAGFEEGKDIVVSVMGEEQMFALKEVGPE
ncbi:unnamed protein product [Arabis nemorensis]|uniref:Uncharacterized protein n=1 Tax=Arabis nemorensis TaxID=586526 RepID=A0A565AYX6_9BRAS|nr:unnamed protein product [Arabis nemorensis]